MNTHRFDSLKVILSQSLKVILIQRSDHERLSIDGSTLMEIFMSKISFSRSFRNIQVCSLDKGLASLAMNRHQ